MCQLFDAFVGSILNYSCEVWGFGKSKVLERIHLKFCKNILKVKSSTSSSGVYGELGRYPLFITRYVRIVKYWSRIANSENILIVHLYNYLVDACNKGVNNWAKSVRSLLDTYGFSYVWNNSNSVNLKHFIWFLSKEWWMSLSKTGSMILLETGPSCCIKSLNNTLNMKTI